MCAEEGGREKMEKVAKNSLALPNLVASDYKWKQWRDSHEARDSDGHKLGCEAIFELNCNTLIWSILFVCSDDCMLGWTQDVHFIQISDGDECDWQQTVICQ